MGAITKPVNTDGLRTTKKNLVDFITNCLVEKMEEVFINKDLAIDFETFSKQLDVNFINDDFESRLEWCFLLIEKKFKNCKSDLCINRNEFNNCFLLSDSLRSNNLLFYKYLTDMQATPEIFPNINFKFVNIIDSFQLMKIKELSLIEKRNIKNKSKYTYEITYSFYMNNTESFYSNKFYSHLNLSHFTREFNSYPKFSGVNNRMILLNKESEAQFLLNIYMAYQLALTMFYEWSILLSEYGLFSFIIPITPDILSEIYNTSVLKFETKKQMVKFISEYYRRKRAKTGYDYDIYVKRYLRGEMDFKYKGFSAKIIPPKYDLLRCKTNKKIESIY